MDKLTHRWQGLVSREIKPQFGVFHCGFDPDAVAPKGVFAPAQVTVRADVALAIRRDEGPDHVNPALARSTDIVDIQDGRPGPGLEVFEDCGGSG